MSALIRTTTNMGWNNFLFQAFTGIGVVVMLIVMFATCDKYGITKRKALGFVSVMWILTYAWMFFLSWVESGFKEFGGQNIVRIFVWLPVFAYPVAKLFKIDYKVAIDFAAPLLCVMHGASHFGCLFGGCCHGYHSSIGVLNPLDRSTMFPIQIIESISALLIAYIIIIRMAEKKYKCDGLSYPIMLVMFGFSRFIWEFFRDNADGFFFHKFLSDIPGLSWCYLSTLQIHALVAGVVGIVWLYAVKKKPAEAKKHEKERVS